MNYSRSRVEESAGGLALRFSVAFCLLYSSAVQSFSVQQRILNSNGIMVAEREMLA
jgi:hypothetical protein